MIMSKVKSIGKKASHWTEHIEKAISLQKFAYGNMCDSRQPIKNMLRNVYDSRKSSQKYIYLSEMYQELHFSLTKYTSWSFFQKLSTFIIQCLISKQTTMQNCITRISQLMNINET